MLVMEYSDGIFRRNTQKTSLNPSTRQGDSYIPDKSITDSLNTPIVNLILILMIKNYEQEVEDFLNHHRD